MSDRKSSLKYVCGARLPRRAKPTGNKLGNMVTDGVRRALVDHVTPPANDRWPFNHARWMRVFLLAVGLLLPAVTANHCMPCPNPCKCYEDGPIDTDYCIVNCADANLTFVPDKDQLPSGKTIVQLDLSGNNINIVTDKSFEFLPNLVYLDLSHLQTTFLPNNVFRNQKKLQVLDLSKSALQTLTRTHVRSNKHLTTLYLNNSAFTTLPSDVFDPLGLLQTLSLHDNPWDCNCELSWLPTWMREEMSQGLMLPSLDDVVCHASLALQGQALYHLNPSQLTCVSDGSQFISCHLERTGETSAVLFLAEEKTVNSQGECELFCLGKGLPYGHVSQSSICLCGRNYTADCNQCPDLLVNPEPLPGSLLCSNYQYINNSFSVNPDVSFHVIRPYSSEEDVHLSISTNPNVSLSNTQWEFSDSSSPVISDDVYHSLFLAGEYTVSTLGYYGNGTIHDTAPLRVLDPVRLGRMQAPVYADIKQKLDLGVVIQQGTNLRIEWTRVAESGNAASSSLNRYCATGWTYIRSRCLISVSDRSATYEQAAEACKQRFGTLAIIKSKNDKNDLIQQLTIDGNQHYTGAQRSGEEYTWSSSGSLAYFNTTLVQGPDLGDCVTLNNQGLKGANCSLPFGYICQRDPIPCKHGGEFRSETSTCYVERIATTTWEGAREACRDLGGQLTMPRTEEEENFLHDILLPFSSASSWWMGLSDTVSQGHYYWVNGEPLGSYHPWNASMGMMGTTKNCVRLRRDLNSTAWEQHTCSDTAAYVCQYPLGDTLDNVQAYVAGTAVPQYSLSGPSTSLSEAATSTAGGLTTLYLWPGWWFSHPGIIQWWMFTASSLGELHLQVYRPSCPSGLSLLLPGCLGNDSPYATCATLPVCLTSDPVCQEGMQHCPVMDTCLAITEPCNCAANLSSYSCPPNASIRYAHTPPLYTLVAENIVQVPNNDGLMKVASSFSVESNDIIGLQVAHNSIPVKCDLKTTSKWTQNAVQVSVHGWTNISEALDLSGYSYTWLDSALCDVRVKYTASSIVSAPTSLTTGLWRHGPGSMTYEGTVSNDLGHFTQTASVYLLYPVFGLGLLNYQATLPAQSPNSIGTVALEGGISQTLLFVLQEGTNITSNWSLSMTNVQFTSDCPAGFSAFCGQASTLRSFAAVEHTFQVATNFTALSASIDAANPLNSNSLRFDVLAMERITQPTLSVSMASARVLANTSVLFQVLIATGTHETYNWSIDNTQISESAFTHRFPQPGIYYVEVIVANAISEVTANTTVLVYTLSLAHNISLNVAPVVAVDSIIPISIHLYLQYMSSLTLTFTYNDTVKPAVLVYDHITHTLTANIKTVHTFRTEGSVSIDVEVKDNIDNSTLTTSTIVQTLQGIKSVTLSSSLAVAVKGDLIAFEASQRGGNGELLFLWDLGDGTTFYGDKDVIHSYTALGDYNVSVIVSNNASEVMDSVTVIIGEPINNLRLEYDGPTAIGDNTTFTATIATGNEVTFTLDLGSSGVAPITQDSGVFKHTYTETGIYNVTVIASNPLGSQVAMVTVYNIDNSSLYVLGLHNSSCVPVGEEVSLTANVIHLDPGSLDYTWRLGDRTSASGTGLQTVQHTYTSPRVYNITVMASSVTGLSETGLSTLCVQERVDKVSVSHDGPLTLPRNQLVTGHFQVTVGQGTSPIFHWIYLTLDVIGPANEHNITFTSLGNKTVTVKVSNEISSEVVYSTISVQEAILDLDMSVSGNTTFYLATNTLYTFQAFVSEGSEVVYIWTVNGSGSQGPQAQYAFTNEGIVTIDLAAENLVSSTAVQRNFTALDPIVSVQLEANTTSLTLGGSVQFNATSSGNTASFSWRICHVSGVPCDWLDSGNVSTMDWHFTTSGVFNVTVTAVNEVSNVSDVLTITVLDVIKGLEIVIQNLTTDYFAVEDDLILFLSMTTSGGVMGYDWTIYNVTTTNQIHETTGPDMRYVFVEDGLYDIKLHAYNTLSNSTATRRIKVVERAGDVFINLESDVVPVNQIVNITGHISAGTSLIYQWFLLTAGNLSLIGQGSDQLIYIFTEIGPHILVLEVTNPISSSITNTTVTVDIPIVGEILWDTDNPLYPYIETGLSTHFQVTQPLVSTANYNWTFAYVNSSSSVDLSGINIQYTISKSGVISFSLNISNALGWKARNDQLQSKERITGVKITPNSLTTQVGKEEEFEVSISGGKDSNPEYIWEFGDQPGVYFNTTKKKCKHTFTQGGLLPVTVIARNQVSHNSDTTQVNVTQEIENLLIANCCVNVYYPLRTVVEFVATVSKGAFVEYYWIFESDDGQEITRRGQKVEVKFPSVGHWTVKLTANNTINSESIKENYTVQENITGLELVREPNQVYIDEEITFTANTATGSHLHYQWSVSPGQYNLSSGSNDTSRQLKISFNRANSYIVTVRVWNQISNQTGLMNVRVYRLMCDPPKVTVVGSPHRRELRSRPINIEVVVMPTDCTWYKSLHHWEIYRDNCTGANSPITLPSDTTVNTPTLFLTPKTLEYGTYCVNFTTQYARRPAADTQLIGLNIVPSSLQAIISGGSERTLAGGYQITLDGSLSYDPDLQKGQTANLSYMWTCHGGPDCFPPTYQSSVTVAPYTFTANQVYDIGLTVWQDGRGTADTSQQILVKPNNVPNSSIDCISCRERNLFTISRSQLVKLLGRCDNCEDTPQYVWSVERDDGELLKLDGSTTTTGASGPNLVIRPGVLHDNHTYTFRLRIDSSEFPSSGYSALFLAPSLPPTAGECEIIAGDMVVALTDTVTTKCWGWMDHTNSPSPLIYHVYVTEVQNQISFRQWYPLYRGTQAETTFYLSPFDEEEGDVIVYIEVIDSVGMRTWGLGKQVHVRSPNMTDSGRTEFLMDWVYTKLPIYQRQNNPRMMLQYIITLLLQLNGEASRNAKFPIQDYNVDRLERENMRRELITILNDTIPISAIEDIQQVAYSLSLVTAYVLEFPRDDAKYRMVTEILEHIVRRITPQVSQGWEGSEFVPVYLLAAIGNLIETIHLDLSVHDVLSDMSQPPGLTSDLTQNNTLDQEAIERRQMLLVTSVTLADEISYLILQTQVAEEEPFNFDTIYFKAQGQRVNSMNIQLEFDCEGSRVKFPPNLLSEFEEEEVFQIVSTLAVNPFIWGYDDGDRVTSQVVSVSFTYANGSEFKVTNLPDDKRISISMKKGWLFPELANEVADPSRRRYTYRTKRSLPSPQQSGQQGPLTDTTETNSNQSTTTPELIKVVELPPGQSLSSVLNTSYGIQGGGGLIIQLRLHGSGQGNDSSQDGPDPLVTAYIGKGYIPHKFKYRALLNVSSANSVMGGAMLKNHIFMEVDNMDYVEQEDLLYLTITNNNLHDHVNLTVEIYLSLCKFYDDPRGLWDKSGCQATNGSSPEWTVCECNHLTLFGASTFIAPGDLDFSDLLRLDLAGNPVVIATLCVVAGLYILLLFVARHWDKDDIQKVSVVPLCGKDGPYRYEITTTTGRRSGAGTSAHVGVKLYGEESKSGAIHLTRPNAFERNAQDVFMVATDTCLGDIWKLHIWHDNSGMDPAWFLSRVVVRDLQSNRKYFFLGDQWLSLTHGKGSIEADLFAAGASELSDFKTIFLTEVSRGFSERHLWLSVLDRPPQNRFTRVQRVTCCVACLYAYLCANALWYGLLRTPTEFETLTGSSYFTWLDILVGIVAAVMVFPLALGLVQLFKKSKKRSVGTGWKRPVSAQTIEIDDLVDAESRGSSATTCPGRRRGIDLIHLQTLDRESTLESLPIQAAPLRRTGNIHVKDKSKERREEDRMVEELLREVSDIDSRYASGNAQGRGRRPSLDRNGHMWGPDTILSWPESIPSWQNGPDGGDSRPNSKSKAVRPYYYRSNKVKAEESKPSLASDSMVRHPGDEPRLDSRERRPSFSRPRRPRLTSVTDSIDEILEDPDMWSRRGSIDSFATRERSMSLDSNAATTKGRPVYIPGAGAESHREGARNEPTLDQLLAELQLDDGDVGEKPRKSSMKSASTSTERNQSRRVSIATSTITTLLPAYPNQHERSWTPFSAWSNGMHFIPPPLPNSNRRECLLPHWCRVIGYIICFLLAGFSIIITLLYGHQFGRDMSLRWLVACVISITLSAFVLEPVKVIMAAIVVALVTKTVDDDPYIQEIQPVLESNEKIKADTKIRPLGGFALLQAKEEGTKAKRMRVILRQFAAYSVLIILVLTINYAGSYGNKGFLLNNHTQEDFLANQFTKSNSFYEISNVTSYWQWLEDVAGPGLHLWKLEPLATHSYLLGRARLRQIRSTPAVCPAQNQLTSFGAGYIVSYGCYGDPEWQEDTAPYQESWVPATPNHTVYQYMPAAEANSIEYHGYAESYNGGGYIQDLGVKYTDTKAIITHLRTINWIDRGTRAVFLEFDMYQTNVNTFMTATMAVEFPVSSGTLPSAQLSPFVFRRHIPGRLSLLTIFMGFLFLVLIYLVVRCIVQMKRQKLGYFWSLSNLLELTLTLLTMTSMVLYGMCVSHDTTAYQRYLDNQGAYTGLAKNRQLSYSWQCVNGFLLLLLIVMIVMQLRFIQLTSVFTKTLDYAKAKLLGCFVIFMIIIIMYSQLTYLWFGSMLYAFRSMEVSMSWTMGLLRSSTGVVIDNMVMFDRRFTPVVVVSFMAVMFVVVFGLVLAVLIEAYRTVKSQMYYHNTMEIQDYEMIDFMMKRFKQWIGATKRKPAFRKVKFQGLPSASSRSTWSSRSRQSSHTSSETTTSCDVYDLDLLEEEGQLYLESLLDRAVPTFERMLQKLDTVDDIDQEEQVLDVKLEEVALTFTPRPDPAMTSKPPLPNVRRSFIPRPLRQRSQDFKPPAKAHDTSPPARSRSLSASGLSPRPVATGNRPIHTIVRETALTDRPYSDQGRRQLRTTKGDQVQPKHTSMTTKSAW